MKTRMWLLVLLPFAAGLLGSTHWGLASPSPEWGQVLASFYCIPIVIAGLTLGTGPAVVVALAAGAFHGAAAILARGDPWVQPIVETMLFVCVGLTAAKFAEWHSMLAVRPALPKEATAESLESSFNEINDSSQMSAVERVVVGLARQFRNPVASIEGAGWVLEDAALPIEKRQEFVGIVRKEAHRLNRVLADVLDFAQPRKPKFQTTDLSLLIDEVIELAGPRDQGPFHLFLKDIPPGFPHLRCDPDQIRQVLLNLAMNAIQASPSGGQIEISARLVETSCVIKVKDPGRGIPAAILDRVFDPFFTTRDNSLGLGLSAALRIVTEHGGKIAIESSSDQGTCMAVTLPAAPAARHEAIS